MVIKWSDLNIDKVHREKRTVSETKLDRPSRLEHLNTCMPYSYDLRTLASELLNEPAMEQSGKSAATLIAPSPDEAHCHRHEGRGTAGRA